MNIDHLVKMVNEIGDFYHGESSAEQAPRDVANHLRRFWEPRMRREMIAHFRRGGGGLSDLARAAVSLLVAEAGAAAPAQAAAEQGPARRGSAPASGQGS